MPVVMLKDVVIRFPALAEPQSMGEGEPAYGGKFPIVPGSENAKALDKALEDAAVQKWEKDGTSVLEMLKEDKKVCYEPRPYKSKKNGEVYNGFEGMHTLGARTPATKSAPTVFNKYGEPVTDKSAIQQLIYDGARVNAKVEVWAQNNKYGRRLNCSLLGVMFAGDGENFSGGAGPAKADDFAGLAAKPDADDVL